MDNTFEKFMKIFNENVRISGVPVNEITVYKGDGISISINRGETETNFPKDPYFKVYNSESISKATLVARVKADGSGYDYHTDGTGKKVWELTKSKKKLIKALTKPPKGGDSKISDCETVWDAIIAGTNIEFDQQCKFPDEMPDFSKIEFDPTRLNGRAYGKE